MAQAVSIQCLIWRVLWDMLPKKSRVTKEFRIKLLQVIVTSSQFRDEYKKLTAFLTKGVCEQTCLARECESYVGDHQATSSVKNLLQNWFYPYTSQNAEATLLGHTTTRSLTAFELRHFEIDSSLLPYSVTIGYTLANKSQKFGSILYKHLKSTHIKLKKCNFFVKYELENSFAYALIEYYIKIEDTIYAAAFKIEITRDDFNLEDAQFSEKFQTLGSLSGIFFEGHISKKKIIINSDSIVSKCIFIKNDENSEVFFSEFISEIDAN
jgi:hypothetical protein